MKWFTHKAVAVAGALAAGAHPAALFAVMVGSVLPDMVDTAMARGDKKVWRRIHRQTSHWFGWYLIIIVLGFLIPTQRIVLDLLRATHITFPGVSPAALAQVRALLSGAEPIEGVRGITIHENCVARDNRYDLMIVVEMEKAALPNWDASEIHHRWKNQFGGMLEKKAIFDYED